MNLKELEDLLGKARKEGASDGTSVYLTNKRGKYMRDVGSVEFEKMEGWPEKEWPVVIEERGQ